MHGFENCRYITDSFKNTKKLDFYLIYPSHVYADLFNKL